MVRCVITKTHNKRRKIYILKQVQVLLDEQASYGVVRMNKITDPTASISSTHGQHSCNDNYNKKNNNSKEAALPPAAGGGG